MEIRPPVFVKRTLRTLDNELGRIESPMGDEIRLSLLFSNISCPGSFFTVQLDSGQRSAARGCGK
jgi:hypothetical protein